MKFIAAAIAGLSTTVEGRCDFDMSHHLTGTGDVSTVDPRIQTINKVVKGVRQIRNNDWKKGYGPGYFDRALQISYFYKLKAGVNPEDAICEFLTVGFNNG